MRRVPMVISTLIKCENSEHIKQAKALNVVGVGIWNINEKLNNGFPPNSGYERSNMQ